MARILLLEDDDNVRLLLEHVLLHEGYTVETAGTASRGETPLQNGNYDLAAIERVLGGCKHTAGSSG